MTSRREFIKSGAGAIAAASLTGLVVRRGGTAEPVQRQGQHQTVVIRSAGEWPHDSRYGTALKGYEESLAVDPRIGASKSVASDLGSTISLIVANQGSQPVTLDKVLVDGIDTATHFDAPPYQVIWNRLLPTSLPANSEGELTLSLRSRLTKNAAIEVHFSDGSHLTVTVKPDSTRLRIATAGFSRDLSSVHLYIERIDDKAPFPKSVWLNGVPIRTGLRWLHREYIDNCAIALIRFPAPLKTGDWYSFRIDEGAASCVAVIRAFSDISRFGQYGYDDFESMAENGLNSFNSFTAIRKERLDEAAKRDIKVAMVIHDEVPKETIGHPAIYSYLAMDEVDVADHSAAPDRPEGLRIGKLAPEMVKWHEKVNAADSITPTMTTLDLTYKPRNYYIYAPLSDIVNADCYPIAIGWPVRSVRDHMRLLKSAAGARPFLFTYQGHFERWGKDPAWQSRAAVLEQGADSLVDVTKKRGFNRKPAAGEVRQQMLYAIGCGARGLFNYTGATEGGVFVNLGGIDLPDVWKVIGEQSRSLRLVSPLLEMAHPVKWTRASDSRIWISTLLCGENAVLVVVVNETAKSDDAGFTLTSLNNISYSLPDLPWLKTGSVAKIKNGQAVKLRHSRTKNAISWVEPALQDSALYLISANESLATNLQRQLAGELSKQTKT